MDSIRWHAGCHLPSRMQRGRAIVDLSRRLLAQSMTDDVAGLAGEIAYRTFLELFPFFIFLAMLGDTFEHSLRIPNPVRQTLELLSGSVPQGAADPIRQQLEGVLNSQQGLLGLPILGVLWLAAGSGSALLKAMNRIYDIKETRPFWERYLVGLWLTLLVGAVLAATLFVVSLGQEVNQQAGSDQAPSWFSAVSAFARWPLLLVILLLEAGVVYRVAPNSKPAWRFITPGAGLFALGWTIASALFVLYVDKTGGYASTYGFLGGVVVLLLWLQITAYALLVGAELNDLLEKPESHVGRLWGPRPEGSPRH